MNYELFKMIHGLSGHNHLLDQIMIFFTSYILPVFALILVLMWLFGNKNVKRAVLYAGVTGVIALIVNFIIAQFYFEPRPFVAHHVHTLVYHAADSSFPSDHTTGTFAIAIALLLKYRKTGLFMLFLAIMTAISRVWVGHHYPLDVVAGIVIGIVVSFIVNSQSFWLDRLFNWIIGIYHKIFNRNSKQDYTEYV